MLSPPGPRPGLVEERDRLGRTPRGAGAGMLSGAPRGVQEVAVPRSPGSGARGQRFQAAWLPAPADSETRRGAGVAAAPPWVTGCRVRGRFAASQVVGFHSEAEQSSSSRDDEFGFPR